MSFKYKDKTIAGSGGGSAEEVYSTNEVRIGTWIDGRPLYRVTISCTTPKSASNTTSEVAKYDADVDQAVRIYGYLLSSEGVSINVPFYQASDNYCHAVYNSSTAINNKNSILACVGSSKTSCPMYVTLEYTKITDQASDTNLKQESRPSVESPSLDFTATSSSTM